MLRLTYAEQAQFAKQLREGRRGHRIELTDRQLVARVSESMKGALSTSELGYDISNEVLQLSGHLTSESSPSLRKLSRNALFVLLDCAENDRHPGAAVFVCRIAAAEAQHETGTSRHYKAPSLLPQQQTAATDCLLEPPANPIDDDGELVRQVRSLMMGYSSMWSTPFVGRLRRSAERVIQALGDPKTSETDRTFARNALHYLVWDEDIINDRLGLVGLVDDAFVLDAALELIEPDAAPWLQILDEIAQQAPYLPGLALQWNGKLERLSEYVLTNLVLGTPSLRDCDRDEVVVLRVVDTGPLPVVLAFLDALIETHRRVQSQIGGSPQPSTPPIPYEKGDLVLVDGKAVAEYDGLELRFNPPRLRLRCRAGGRGLSKWEFLEQHELPRLAHAPEGRKVFGNVARRRAEAKATVSVLERLFHLEWRDDFSHTQPPIVLVTGLGNAKELLSGLKVLGDPLMKVLPIGAVTEVGDDLEIDMWNQLGGSSAVPALIVARTPELAAEYLDGSGVEAGRVYIDGQRTAGWNQAAIEQFEGLAPVTLVTSTDNTRQLGELVDAGTKLWAWKASDLSRLIWPKSQPGHPLSDFASRTQRSIGGSEIRGIHDAGGLTTEVLPLAAGAEVVESLRQLRAIVRQHQDAPLAELVEVIAAAHRLFGFVRLAVAPLVTLAAQFKPRLEGFEQACTAAIGSNFLSSEEKTLIELLRAGLNQLCNNLSEATPKARLLDELLINDPNTVPVLSSRGDVEMLRLRTALPLSEATTAMSKAPYTAPERGVITGWFRGQAIDRWVNPAFANQTRLLLYDIEVPGYERWSQARRNARRALESLVDRSEFFDGRKNWPGGSISPLAAVDDVEVANDLDALDEEATKSVTQMLLHRSNSSASRADVPMPAYRVSFADDSFAFVTEYFRAQTATHLLTGEAPDTAKASLREKSIQQLRIGDILVFRGGSERDVIREAADETLPSGLRDTASLWNQALCRWAEHNEAGARQLQKRLAACGCQRTIQTVHKWLHDPNTIGPRDAERGALKSIAKATGDADLEARLGDCAKAIHEVRAAHLQVSHRLGRMVLDSVAKEVGGAMVDDYLVLKNGTLLLPVTDIDRNPVAVPSGSTNRLLNSGVK